MVRRGIWQVLFGFWRGGADGGDERGSVQLMQKTSIRERMLRGRWKTLVSSDFQPPPSSGQRDGLLMCVRWLDLPRPFPV